MMEALFALSGAATGIVEAGLLARTARAKVNPLSFLVRLALVAVVLVGAAQAGHLLSAAGGWMLGFLIAAVVAYRRLPYRRRP